MRGSKAWQHDIPKRGSFKCLESLIKEGQDIGDNIIHHIVAPWMLDSRVLCDIKIYNIIISKMKVKTDWMHWFLRQNQGKNDLLTFVNFKNLRKRVFKQWKSIGYTLITLSCFLSIIQYEKITMDKEACLLIFYF